jgi:bacterioferritin-associated ferredoxin
VYVCSCFAVSSRTVVALVDQGVTTVEEIGSRCGAGTGCGQCRPVLVAYLEGHGPSVVHPLSERPPAR